MCGQQDGQSTVEEEKELKIGYFDIETTAIPWTGIKDVNTIFAIGVKINDEPTKKFSKYYLSNSDGNLQAAVKLLNSCDLIVSFNGIAFDIPVIERVLNCKLTPPHLDLIIVAKLMYSKDALYDIDYKILRDEPNLIGSFSLKAFGRRIGGRQKIEFEDWSKLSSEMLDYMVGDVELTKDLHEYFSEKDTFLLTILYS